MNNKQKIRKVYESLIQYSILVQLAYLNLNEIRSLLIIDQIRQFSYIIQPTLSHHNNNPYLIFKVISYLPRPYLIFEVNYSSFIYLVTMFFIFICIIIFKVSIYVLVKQNQKYILLHHEITLKHFIDSQISILKVLDRIISVFIYFLEKNILQFSVEQFLSMFLHESSILKTMAVLFISFYILMLCFKIVNLGQAFLFQSETAQLRKLLIIFQTIQSIVFILDYEFQFLQYLLCICISLIIMTNIFCNVPYLCNNQYLIVIFIQSFTFIFALTEIMVLYKYIDHLQSQLSLLIIFPFCFYILLKQYYNNSLKLLYYKLNKHTKFKNLQFRNLYILIYDKGSNKIVKAIINQIHCIQCNKCQCSQEQIGNQIIIQFSKELLQEQDSDYIETRLIYIFSLYQGQQYIQTYIISEELLNQKYNQLNLNQQIRYKLMIEFSKKSLKLKLYKFEDKNFQYLNDFYQGQLLIIIINNCVLKSIQFKEQFIVKFQKYKIIEDKLFNLCLKYAKKIYKLYTVLLELKSKQKSQLLNNTIIFYQAEILNDYIGAYKLHLQNIDEKSNLNGQSIEFSTQSQNVSYIITVLNDSSYNMKITSTSNNASSFFQVNIPLQIDNLIPLGIREHHSQYIEQLLVKGESGRYRTLSNVFAQQKQYINLVDSYLDTYFNMNNLTFVNIFIEKDDVHSYIILNKKFQITGINRILLLMMNYKQSTIKRFQPQSILYGLHINYLIPHFDHQIRQFVNMVSLSELNNQFSTEFKFFKQKIISKLNQHNYEEKLQDSNFIQIYDSLVEIEIKYLKGEIAYYVLKIISLRKKTLTLSTSFQSNFQTMQDDFVENDLLEDVDVNSPLIFQDIVPENTISSENSSNKINTNQHFERRLQRKLKTMKVANDYINGRNQQKFFTRRLGIANSDLSIEIQESQRQRTQKKRITYNESSEFTLSYNIKNSIYFDKYQMIQNFSNQPISSKYSKLSSLFFIVSCILGIISLQIQSVILTTDFNSYNQDIRFLKVKQDILQPIMNQVILRVILLNIRQNATINFQQSEITNLLNNEFAMFHQSVDSILSDNEMSVFFNNINIPIKLDIESEIEQQTFRQVISKFQQYLFYLMMIYKYNQYPQADDPAIKYTYRNYQSLSIEFSKISKLVLDRTIQRNSSQIDTQTIIIVCFLCLNSIFLLLSYRSNKFNYQIKSLFSNLFMNFDKELYKIELEETQYLQKNISIEDIQFYSFNIQYKEKILNKLKQQVGDKIEKTQFFKLPTNNKILMYSIVLGIMSILFLSINLVDLLILSHFTTEYQPTALLYQEMSILGVSIAQIFAQRQILYDYKIFQFLDESDRQILLNQVQDSLTQIDKSRKIFINVQNINYLYSNLYYTEFQKNQYNNLCILLAQVDDLKQTKSVCEYLLQGSLKLGLQNVLGYLTNTINSEIIQSQEFNDVNYQGNKEDYIGGYLLSKIIQIMVSQGQADLLGEIESYNEKLQIILITSITFITMIILMIIITQIKIYNEQLQIAKRFIHLLPKSIIFFDNSFERRVTNTIINNQNI